MSSGDSDMKMEEALLGDAAFLAEAVLTAERAHTGRGLWDVYFSESEDMTKEQVTCNALVALQRCIEEGRNAIYYHKRFLIIRDTSIPEGAKPVATACAYKYPDVSILTTLKCLEDGCRETLGWTDSTLQNAESRLSFLSECFPDNVEFDGRWLIEGVYADPSYRGKGLATRIMKQLLQKGQEEGCKEALITCAVGNTPAFSLYTKLGFEPLGHGSSRKCLEEMSTEGFYLLRYVF